MEAEKIQPELEETPEVVEAEETETSEVAEEETPVEAAAEEEVTEETPDEEQGQVDEVPEVDPGSDFADQLAELREELEKANKRLGYEQRQREKLEKEYRQQFMPREPDAEAPKQEDFETFEEFQQADVDYRVKKGISDYQKQQMQMTQQSSLDGFIEETTTVGREMFKDFDDVVLQNHVPITAPMLNMMKDAGLEHPESIVYYLGKNIKDATAISRMSPPNAIRALTQIESKVKAELSKNPTGSVNNPPQPPKKVSNAPPPVKPAGSANVVNKDPEKMTMAEYEAWRRKGGGRS